MKILQALKVFILRLLIRCGILKQRRIQVPLNYPPIDLRHRNNRMISPNRKHRRANISETKRKSSLKLNAAKQRRLTPGE